jgi:hypothetical protein
MSTGKRSSILKGLFFYVDNCMILYIYIYVVQRLVVLSPEMVMVYIYICTDVGHLSKSRTYLSFFGGPEGVPLPQGTQGAWDMGRSRGHLSIFVRSRGRFIAR